MGAPLGWLVFKVFDSHDHRLSSSYVEEGTAQDSMVPPRRPQDLGYWSLQTCKYSVHVNIADV